MKQVGKDSEMDSEKKRIRRKKFFIMALCAVLGAAALFGYTYTRYTYRSIDGKVEYEPALFNTVLLGQLVQEDIDKLEELSGSDSYQVRVYHCESCESDFTSGSSMEVTSCPTCGGELTYTTYNQTYNGEKITASLDLSENVEFGVDTGNNTLQVAPGSDSADFAYINFSVTNGTTLEDYMEAETDAEGNATNTTNPTPRVANLAESDIKYTIHIKTTNNLPLKYQLKDLSTGITYDLTDNNEKVNTYVEEESTTAGQTETTTRTYEILEKSAQSDYVVSLNQTSTANQTVTSDFVDGTRLLKCNSDGSITVHRYQIIITWPSKSIKTKTYYDSSNSTVEPTVETEVVMNNDLSYMKELENIEVLLEVESYVDYKDRTENSDTTSDGVVILSDETASDGLYYLRKPRNTTDPISGATKVVYDDVPYYANKIINVGAFDSISADDMTVTEEVKNTLYNNNYEYVLHVYNTDAVAATWTEDSDVRLYEDPVVGNSTIRAANGHTDAVDDTNTTVNEADPINGHYAYSADYSGGNGYHIIMAVPSGDDRVNYSGIDWAEDSSYAYYLVYEGETYKGVLTTEVVQSTVQTYGEVSQTRDNYYEEEELTLYKAMRFYKVDSTGAATGTEISVDFSTSEFQEEEFTIYRTQATSYESCKDDFRLYIDKTAN